MSLPPIDPRFAQWLQQLLQQYGPPPSGAGVAAPQTQIPYAQHPVPSQIAAPGLPMPLPSLPPVQLAPIPVVNIPAAKTSLLHSVQHQENVHSREFLGQLG